MSNYESRTFDLGDIEVRAVEGQPTTIAGYAVVFDSWSEVMTDARGRLFRERIAPSAFDRALAGSPDIRALWNHNTDKPLGRTRNGTLRVSKDGAGLRVELQPPATSWGVDAVASISRGDVSGMSFAFSARKEGGDTWAKPGADGIAERTLLDAELYEVSPVTFPAYPATQVMVRSVTVPDEFESDGQAADEIQAASDNRAVVTGLLREQIDILRRR
ncbi:MAG: HK97 family phage prohead protease [Caldilineaceae bacterium]|nr:HK97 family phage prohead protease [Caldilineaceae bacterium]